MKDLGDRMKGYEAVTQIGLCPRTPVVLRLDGRAFHTLTRRLEKPFSYAFIDAMIDSAVKVCDNIQGFKLGYVQSDEVNIVFTDYDKLNSDGWFDYKLSKIVSVASGLMSAHFSNLFGKVGVFDCRAFNIPEDEIANYFLWRVKDWLRNSLNMFAGSFFSHKELMHKSSADKHEMLHSIGKNWADLDLRLKNGTWVKKYLAVSSEEYSTYAAIDALLERDFWRVEE
jgi:tRNA(His) guanylyltransferase